MYGEAGHGQLDVNVAARPENVQHLDSGRADRIGRVQHRVVQRPGALRAAGDQQHRQVRPEPEVRPGLVGQGQPVQAGDLVAQRDPDIGGMRQLGVGLAGEHVRGKPRAEPVGQPGPGVGLVHHDRHVVAPGGQVTWRGHIAAEPHEHVRAGPVEHPRRGTHRGAAPARHPEQLRGQLAGQRNRRDQRQLVAPQGNQPGLQATLGPQAHDAELRVSPAQRIGEGQRRLDMARGPPAREYDAHRPALPFSPTAPGRGRLLPQAGQAQPA